jgi:hypothetical protein
MTPTPLSEKARKVTSFEAFWSNTKTPENHQKGGKKSRLSASCLKSKGLHFPKKMDYQKYKLATTPQRATPRRKPADGHPHAFTSRQPLPALEGLTKKFKVGFVVNITLWSLNCRAANPRWSLADYLQNIYSVIYLIWQWTQISHKKSLELKTLP